MSLVDPAIAQTESDIGVGSAANLTYCSMSLPCDDGHFCEFRPNNSLGATGVSTEGYCNECPKNNNHNPMNCLYVRSGEDVTSFDLLPPDSKKQNILRYVAVVHKSY
jgi:hypothetical protein